MIMRFIRLYPSTAATIDNDRALAKLSPNAPKPPQDPLLGTWVLNQGRFVGLPSEYSYGEGFNIVGYIYTGDEIISSTYDYIDLSTGAFALGNDTSVIAFLEDYPRMTIVYDGTPKGYKDAIIRQQLSTFTINNYPTSNTDFINTLLAFLQANATKIA